jgi:hypothetical protein
VRRHPIPTWIVDRADSLKVSGLTWEQISILLGFRAERLRAAVGRARRRAKVGP